jgi:nitrate reductase gamma subunit
VPMSETLEFVRGPLFVLTFSFMLLGLLRLVVLRSWELIQVRQRTPKRDIPWKIVLRRSAGWIVPVKHVLVSAPILKVASFVFHVGLIIVPVLLIDHVYLWSRGVGFGWPAIGGGLADVLTLVTIGTGLVLLLFRSIERTARNLSTSGDYALLLVLLVPFLSGFFASHPATSPLTYQTMLLIHVLSAELVFVLMPTTKLAHVVMFPFDRLSADIFWRLVPGAGARVAETLRGSKEGIEA